MNTFRIKVIDFSNDFENHSEGIATSSIGSSIDLDTNSSYNMTGSGAEPAKQMESLLKEYETALKGKGKKGKDIKLSNDEKNGFLKSSQNSYEFWNVVLKNGKNIKEKAIQAYKVACKSNCSAGLKGTPPPEYYLKKSAITLFQRHGEPEEISIFKKIKNKDHKDALKKAFKNEMPHALKKVYTSSGRFRQDRYEKCFDEKGKIKKRETEKRQKKCDEKKEEAKKLVKEKGFDIDKKPSIAKQMIEAIEKRNTKADIWNTYKLSEKRKKQIETLPASMTTDQAEAELKKLTTNAATR